MQLTAVAGGGEVVDSPRCSGLMPLFFDERAPKIDKAKRICARCPMRDRCLEDTLAFPPSFMDGTGVFGGTTPAERRAIRRARSAGAAA